MWAKLLQASEHSVNASYPPNHESMWFHYRGSHMPRSLTHFVIEIIYYRWIFMGQGTNAPLLSVF